MIFFSPEMLNEESYFMLMSHPTRGEIVHLIASLGVIGYAFSQGVSHSDSVLHDRAKH